MTKECELVLGKKAQGVDVPSALSILKGKVTQQTLKTPWALAGVSGTSVLSQRLTVRNKGGAVIANNSLPRATGSAASLRGNAKSPSPPVLESDVQDASQQANGLVISNHNDPNFMEDEDGEDMREMEGLKKEEEEDLSFLIDSRLLHKDFIVDKFSLALIYYGKAGKLGSVPHMEALLKFSKYLVDQKHFGKAADILQKMLKIEGISVQDQLSLYQTMASIYHSIGFHRKAAMFTFYAARHANLLAEHLAELQVARVNRAQLIHKAHELLVDSLPGFKLSRDLETLPDTMAAHRGWPTLQASVLTDFVYLSKKLGEDLIVIKHACYLLEMLHSYMEISDLKKVSAILERVVDAAMNRCMESPAFTSSVVGKLSSPIPLTHFPLVRSFYPRPLIKIMAPHRQAGFKSQHPPVHERETNSKNPFIYTPFGPGKKAAKRKEVLWVEKDPAEMALSISNPLPFELRVENMAVMLEGSKVEIFPSSLTLPGGSEQSQFVLVSIPHETGVVTVQGYEATVFGVHYQCNVKIPGNPIIRVIPKLPLLQVRSFPVPAFGSGEDTEEPRQRRHSKVGMDKFDLLDGESGKFLLELLNVGDRDISSISAFIAKTNEEHCDFHWDKELLTTRVPLLCNKHTSLEVSLQARLPVGSRLSGDMAGSARPTGSVVPIAPRRGSSPVGGDLAPTGGVASSGSLRSRTPNSSPSIKRGRGHQRKASNEGFERGERTGSSLMDSLNLDTPLYDAHSNSNTLPNLGRSSPSGNLNKRNSLRRPKKTKGLKRSGLDYDDVEFGLDKRASVRSDPGERERKEKGRFRSVKQISGSSHTSPTSSTINMATPTSQPVSIPHMGEVDLGGSPLFKVGSELVGKGLRNTVKGRTPITKLNISLPQGPLYKEVVQSPEKTKVEGKFIFQYSGGEGASEGYYREVEATIAVNVHPCLLFEQLEISSTEKSQELFQFSFVMHNVSSLHLRVTCRVDQAGLAESGGTTELVETVESNFSRKCCFLIRKFNVESDGSSSPGTKNEIHFSKLYSKRLKEMLGIRWEEDLDEEVGEGESKACPRSGVITLEGLCLPVTSVNIMKPHPILFSLFLNGESHSLTYSKNVRVGTLQRVLVKVTNNSPVVMPVSFLVVESYAFSEEARSLVKNLSGLMLHSDNLATNVPKLSPGSSFEHAVCFTFLHKAHYVLDFKIVVPNTVAKDTATENKKHTLSKNLSTTKSTAQKTEVLPPQRVVSPPCLSPVTPPSSPPLSPSSGVSSGAASPTPLRPNSARAIAQKYEMMELAARATSIPQRNKQNKNVSTSQETPSGKTTPPVAASPPVPSSNHLQAPDSRPPSSDPTAPPPVPTSSRPHITRSVSMKSSSPGSGVRNRSHTVHMKPAVLAKPLPLSSTNTSASSSLKTSVTGVSSLAPPSSSVPQLRTQNSVLLTAPSKYQSLWRDRPQNSTVKVTTGPSLSFYVNNHD